MCSGENVVCNGDRHKISDEIRRLELQAENIFPKNYNRENDVTKIPPSFSIGSLSNEDWQL